MGNWFFLGYTVFSRWGLKLVLWGQYGFFGMGALYINIENGTRHAAAFAFICNLFEYVIWYKSNGIFLS